MALIPITGLSSSDPVPGFYAETSFAAGPSSGDSGPKSILVLANKLAAGSGVLDTVVYGADTTTPLRNEQDMIALAGSGSEAHRMFLRMVPTNTTTPIYWVFVTESAGSAATGTIVATNNATSAGNLRVWVCDDFVEVPYASGSTPTVIGDAIAAAINGKSKWPVTAANVAGTVTLTAKQKGPRGNFIRYQAVKVAGTGTTFSAVTDAPLSGGTTEDSNTAALAALKGRGDYYLVSAATSGAQLAAALAYIDTQSMPTNGNRKRLVGGSSDTLANANAIAIGLNAARAEVVWQYKSIWTPAELAAHHAAIYALEEGSGTDQRTNFCGYGSDERTQRIYKVPPPRDQSAFPDRDTDIKVAILNGLSPIGVDSRGIRCNLVIRVTTRTLLGSVPDYRIRGAHKVTTMDSIASTLGIKTAAEHSGKIIGDDPASGEPEPPPNVITPRRYKATVFSVLDTYAGAGLIQRLPEIKAGTVVQRETVPASRMSVYSPIQTADNAEQFAALLAQVAVMLVGLGSVAAAILNNVA